MKHYVFDIKGELSRAFPDQSWFIEGNEILSPALERILSEVSA